MAAPGRQRDEQSLVSQLVAAPLVYPVIEQVGEVPAAAVQVDPAEPDPSIGGLGGEVDHHHVPAIAASHVVSNAATRAVSGPGPGEEVTAGIVVGPAGHLEQLPVARPYPVAGHGGQQPPVPAGQGGSDGSPGRRDRKTGGRTRRPSNCPSCHNVAPGRVAMATAAARSASPGSRPAMRGSSWFSRKRTSRDW